MSTDTNKNNLSTTERDKELFAELGIKPGQPNEFDGKSDSDLAEEQRRLDVALKQLELTDRLETMATKKRVKDQKRAEYQAKSREILTELARRAAQQRGCSHRKGGTARSGSAKALPIEGGDSDMYAIIKHKMPTGQWWCLCARCGAEWWPKDKYTGRPATIIGDFTYEMALAARSDNTPSGSVVFQFEDFRTPEQVEADQWKPPVDEAGKPARDIYANPPNKDGSGVLQPSTPVRATR